MGSNLTVKTLVCWAIAHSVERIHIFKIGSLISFYRDTKYPLEISLMRTDYLGPATTLVKNY